MSDIYFVFWVPSLATFLAFAWAVKFHFSSDRTPFEMKVISSLAICLMLTAMVRTLDSEPRPFQTAVALLSVGVSAGLFYSALIASRGQKLSLAFDERRPSQVISKGPYAWIRHPFYAAYMLFWTALVVFSESFFVTGIAAMLVGFYVRAARREEMFLRQELGIAYTLYSEQAGFLVPKLWRKMR